MKHLRLFKTEVEYNSATLDLPNVSYVEDTEVVIYTPGSEGPVAPVGASIYGLDGKFYSVSEWTAAGKSNSDAVGVAVSDGEHSFVIHPTAESTEKLAWSSNMSVAIDGVFTTNDMTDPSIVEGDFAGAANTAAILAAVSAGTIADAPAAQYAAGITFANGKIGYLPSMGELTLAYQHLTEINNCMTIIGGKEFSMSYSTYCSSTQFSDTSAWRWHSSYKCPVSYYKNNTYRVRVVSTL